MWAVPATRAVPAKAGADMPIIDARACVLVSHTQDAGRTGMDQTTYSVWNRTARVWAKGSMLPRATVYTVWSMVLPLHKGQIAPIYTPRRLPLHRQVS